MTELNFKGKEFVYNHHLSVPFQPLVMDAGKVAGEPSLAENLIIHRHRLTKTNKCDRQQTGNGSETRGND